LSLYGHSNYRVLIHFNDILPYQRTDENCAWTPPKKKTPKKKKGQEMEHVKLEPEAVVPPAIPDEEVRMGGPEGRVYWPPGMEEWLRLKKKEAKKRDPAAMITTAEKAAAKRAEKAKWQADTEAAAAVIANGRNIKPRTGFVRAQDDSLDPSEVPVLKEVTTAAVKSSKGVTGKKRATPKRPAKKAKTAKNVPTPSTSDRDENINIEDDEDEDDDEMPDLDRWK
jgi:UV DNA damage endonuclease